MCTYKVGPRKGNSAVFRAYWHIG